MIRVCNKLTKWDKNHRYHGVLLVYQTKININVCVCMCVMCVKGENSNNITFLTEPVKKMFSQMKMMWDQVIYFFFFEMFSPHTKKYIYCLLLQWCVVIVPFTYKEKLFSIITQRGQTLHFISCVKKVINFYLSSSCLIRKCVTNKAWICCYASFFCVYVKWNGFKICDRYIFFGCLRSYTYIHFLPLCLIWGCVGVYVCMYVCAYVCMNNCKGDNKNL